jgi:hypothetical protein
MESRSESPPVVSLNPQIVGVTVHADGAEVRRRAALPNDLSTGSILQLGGLPLFVATERLSLRLLGAPNWRLGEFEGEGELTMVAGAPVGSSATERALGWRLRDIVTRKERRERLLEGLRAMHPAERTVDAPGPRKPQIGSWIRLGEARRELLGRLRAELRRAEAEREAAAEALAQAQEQARNGETPQGARLTRSFRLRVTGEGPLPPGAEIEVLHPQEGARWAPGYRLEIQGYDAVFSLQARIGQATGEAWERVNLGLSTAPLSRTISSQRLPVLRIGRAGAALPPGWRPLPADTDALFGGLDSAGPHPGTQSERLRLESLSGVLASLDELDTPTGNLLDRAADGLLLERGPRNRKPPVPEEAFEGEAAPFAAVGGAAPGAVSLSAPPAKIARARGSISKSEPQRKAGSVHPRIPPPPSLNFGGLLLGAPEDRETRGRLLPAGIEADLSRLAEAHTLGFAELQVLREMVKRTERRQRRLREAPLPPGCLGLDEGRAVADQAMGGEGDGFSLHHRIDTAAQIDLPDDGDMRTFEVVAGKTRVRTYFVVVPRQDASAWRMAELDSPLPCPLLPGPLSVLESGSLRAETRLHGAGRGGRLRVSLGPEPLLKVSRQATFREEARGAFGGELALIHQINLRLRNHTGAPARVEVIERLPSLEEQKGCSIQWDDHRTPSPQSRDLDLDGRPAKGAVIWHLDLAPGETKEWTWGYTIKMPKSLQIVGGGRREP